MSEACYFLVRDRSTSSRQFLRTESSRPSLGECLRIAVLPTESSFFGTSCAATKSFGASPAFLSSWCSPWRQRAGSSRESKGPCQQEDEYEQANVATRDRSIGRVARIGRSS